MAKSIKAIKCPQCGSPQKTEVRPEHFRCDNCGTEYFLDNDDININQTVRQTGPAGIPLGVKQLLAIGLGVIFLLFLLSKLFESDPLPAYVAARPPVAEAVPPTDMSYSWSGAQEHLYLTASRQPVLFVMGPRSYTLKGGPQNLHKYLQDSCFASFYDARTGRELKSIMLPELSGKRHDLRFKPFVNGGLYVVADEKRVYEVDQAAFTVTDVSQALFQGQPELSSGVAKIVGMHYARNDGFELLGNDGRKLFFYPLIKKVYSEKDYYKARGNFNTLRPNNVVATDFAFSSSSTDYPEEKRQLIRYQYRSNVGGPQEPARFNWSRDYGRAGIFNGTEPHTKSLVNAYNMQQMRLLSYKDLTPGRLYFKPEVLDSDAEQVLIQFRPTAADDSAPVMQRLDAKTGAIKFTTPLPTGFVADQALRYAGGFVLRDDDKVLLLGPDGTPGPRVAIP